MGTYYHANVSRFPCLFPSRKTVKRSVFHLNPVYFPDICSRVIYYFPLRVKRWHSDVPRAIKQTYDATRLFVSYKPLFTPVPTCTSVHRTNKWSRYRFAYVIRKPTLELLATSRFIGASSASYRNIGQRRWSFLITNIHGT